MENTKKIILTEEEIEYLGEIVFEHTDQIGNEISYGNSERNEYMKNLFNNILNKL